jgi:recombinational DNA repair ATPase RecF
VESLIEQLRQKLAGSRHKRADEIGPLVEAAFAGDGAVGFVLNGEPVTHQPEPARSARPATAHLASIGVQGFRGIGRRAELQLNPGPGLTLVVGRNGSGKSSFAEGLEMLLTGDNLRWKERSAVWRDGWRNLHESHQPVLDAELCIEGQPETAVLQRWWDLRAGLDDSETRLELPGGTRTTIGWLDWTAPLDNYRPFLSYNELGSMLTGKPSNIHDAMSVFLGLEEGQTAAEILRQRRLALQKPEKELAGTTIRLRDELRGADDHRAAAALAALETRPPDIARLSTLVAGAGTDPDRDSLAPARTLAQLALPATDHMEAAATELATALTLAAESAGTDAGQARHLAGLLHASLGHWHHDRSETSCPVCGTTGVLGDQWAASVGDALAELEQRATAATALAERLNGARQAATTLLTPVPATLRAASSLDIDGTTEAVAAWETWAKAPPSDIDLVSRLRSFDPVAALAEQARRAARELVDQHDLRWQPHAQAIASWLQADEAARQATAQSKRIKVAEDWMKAALTEIRNERFEPISTQARELWEVLRHRSNVQLDQIALEGSASNRRVSLEVTVDGVPAAALSVMSQGELHALALSLFLPRAMMDDSPFRFMVIDDPDQAMDPARVDGLARVLQQVAADRQVIVLTHDDRLPEAVRRLGITAEHIEVTRQAGSVVSTRPVWDPVQTALDDARAIARTASMTGDARCKVVPGYCRLALEAAAMTVVRRRRLGRGESHENLERLISGTRATLKPLLALALFDDADRHGDVAPELQRRHSATWSQVVEHCNAGSHGRFSGDPAALVDDTRQLAQWVAALA